MLKDLLINHLAPGEIDRTGERVDGKATIIGKLGYNWIAVLDAQYRTLSVMSAPSATDPVGLYEVGSFIRYDLPNTMSAAEIMALGFADLKDSKTNASAVLPYYPISQFPAAYAANVHINGGYAYLPNAQALAFILSRSSFIDANDPTVGSYPDRVFVKSPVQQVLSSTLASRPAKYVSGYSSGSMFYMTTVSYDSPAMACPILEIPAYEDRTGERIDGKATIIGRLGENWIAVLDAAYRGTANYSTGAWDVTAGIPYTSGTYTINSGFTENQILAQRLYDIHSSKWNTDYLNQAQTATNFPAAKMCYDITVGGKHAQLPNIQATAFVYSKRNYIDANDPTAATNTAKKLSNWGFGAQHVFSSTGGVASSTAVGVTEAGKATELVRTATYGVIPILEIPLYKDRTGERVDGKATIAGKLGNYWIAVLDAAYRSTSLAWGTSTDIFNITILGTNYSFPYSAGEAAFLNTAQLRNNNTSRDLTNVQTSTRPAALFCRDTILAGFQCSLPNIQTMSFVRSWKTWLDSQDPTVSENQGASLSNSNLNMWTSSPKSNSATEAYLVGNNIAMSTTRTSQHGVCPILEIPLWCDDDYK